MDHYSSFLYLVDNLAVWQACIDSLTAHAVEKNADFAAEYTRLVSQSRPMRRRRRRRTPSVASIHTQEEAAADDRTDAAASIDDSSAPELRHINPLEAGNRHLFAQARRKRNPGPSIRSGASGPQKYRNSNHMVVYYDGYIQERLDDLVKQLGLGRNHLRKGKAALAAATGFRLPALAARAGHESALLDDVRPSIASRSTPALLLVTKPSVAPSQLSDHEASFLQADKKLEQIQSLCETAAHQFLRDGDCKAELDRIRQSFDALLVQATAAMTSLKTLKESQQEVQSDTSASDASHACEDSDETLAPQSSLHFLRSSRIGAAKDLSPLVSSRQLEFRKPQGFLSAPTIPNNADVNVGNPDTIEVDDASDQESIFVDISAYRLSNAPRVRV